jgi:hypothetical protein
MTNLKTLITALLLGTSVLAGAQESDMEDRKIRFGLQASPNFGWMNPNISQFEKDGLQPRLGFGYGLVLDYKFSESSNYLFSTGFNITSSGGGLIESYDSTSVFVPSAGVTTEIYYTGKLDRTYRLNYVNVPLLLKMRTNEIGYMSYFAAIGIDLGFRTRVFANDQFDWEDNAAGPALGDSRKDLNITKQMNFFRTALNISAGGEYNLSGNTNIYFGLGWHNGFLNAFRNKDFNRILEPNSSGYPKIDENTNRGIESVKKKAFSNYISLDLGIFF